jgi:hypothetical protein
MSFTLAGPRFLSFDSVAVGMMCSAGAVASLDRDVPIGNAGLMYDSTHAMR